MRISIAILISGRGSNMKAILEAISRGELDARVSVVLSNNPNAAGLEVATEYGVPTVCVPSKGRSREEHEQAVLNELAKFDVDYVVLAGYMRVLTPTFLRAFTHEDGYFRVINIHPSLLPAFPGASGYEDAYQAGVTKSGITVHLVDEEVDHGPILAQAEFERLSEDTLESFKARGLALEHQLFPRVLQQVATNGIRLTVTK